MIDWRTLSVRIRRRQSPFYDRLYRLAKAISSFSAPCVKPLHSLLYLDWVLRRSAWHNFWRIAYYEPIFKSQCASVGKGFRMLYAGNGSAQIIGPLAVYIGDNVTIFDNTSFVGLKVLDRPELHIGDNTYIGPFVRIMVGGRVRIGKSCLITSRIITDNPGHSLTDVMSRMASGGGSPAPMEIKDVTIGDFCFLPLDTVVYPGVTVGDGVVARIGTHIHRDVPPFCQIAGNPARIIRKLPIPPAMINIVGREKYESYLAAHKNIALQEKGISTFHLPEPDDSY